MENQVILDITTYNPEYVAGRKRDNGPACEISPTISPASADYEDDGTTSLTTSSATSTYPYTIYLHLNSSTDRYVGSLSTFTRGLSQTSMTTPVQTARSEPSTSNTRDTATSISVSSTTFATSFSLRCSLNGAPWFEPTRFEFPDTYQYITDIITSRWCDCGLSATYPTISGGEDETSSAPCSYTQLPASMITPVTVSAIPTNVPGLGGKPKCAAVMYPNGQACINADCKSLSTQSLLLCRTFYLRELSILVRLQLRRHTSPLSHDYHLRYPDHRLRLHNSTHKQ